MCKRRLHARRIILSLILLSICLPSIAQDRDVTGKVTDSRDGSPIVGATVTAKGSATGTTTGADGVYKLKIPAGKTVLVISSVGFATTEVTIGRDNTLDVKMLYSSATALNEVVVIGYGTARKKDLTGALATVTAKDFVKGPITSPEQLIAGKVAGVQIISNSGMPGAGSRIRIRGGTSLNASNEPLIVIDGVPLENTRDPLGNSKIQGAPDPLSLINPNDIESFSILKDASAAAIYGSRAANGVILVTTKKGLASDKARISFSSLNSISVKTGEVDVLNAAEFTKLVNEFGSASEKAMLGTENTNWQDQIYQTAFSTDNNISLSGGIRRLPYRLSLGYLNQDGILKRSNLQRNSVSLNLSPKFLDNHLSVYANMRYSYSENFFANQGAIGSSVLFDPTKPVYSGKTEYGGYYEWLIANGDPNDLAIKNPVGLLNMRDDQSKVHRFIGNIQLDYKFHFLPQLRANLNLGTDRSSSKGDIFVPAEAAQSFFRGGIKNHYEQEKENKLLEFYLNYLKDIPSIYSRIDVTAGYTYQDWLTKSPAFPQLRADGSVFEPASTPFETQNTLVSFYGRLNYGFYDRYLFTFTFRRDGSSRFSEDNRWGNFPSAALAWKIIDEPFMRGSNIFSNLKLRLGWGITGQQDNIADYGYQSNIFYGDSAAQYQFGNGYYVVARPQGYDADLKWEETESRNIGLDIGFAENRINLTLDYYQKETRDLLATVPVPSGTNFTNLLLTNVGSIENSGFELGVNAIPYRNKDFTLDLGYNFTYIFKNDITKLQLVNDPNYLGADVGNTGFNNVQKHSVGYRPYTFFLYRQVYEKDGTPIEGLYEDKNNDGIIGEADKYWVKNPEPKVFMGFTANATYRKFGAGFVMRASIGNYMYNGVNAGNGILQQMLNGQNNISNVPADILVTRFRTRQTWSDYYLENASFVRMDNLYVNYDVGKVFKEKVRMRLSFNCQNVFVITDYSGLDPEVAGGIDGEIFPRPRMYALGINLDF